MQSLPLPFVLFAFQPTSPFLPLYYTVTHVKKLICIFLYVSTFSQVTNRTFLCAHTKELSEVKIPKSNTSYIHFSMVCFCNSILHGNLFKSKGKLILSMNKYSKTRIRYIKNTFCHSPWKAFTVLILLSKQCSKNILLYSLFKSYAFISMGQSTRDCWVRKYLHFTFPWMLPDSFLKRF